MIFVFCVNLNSVTFVHTFKCLCKQGFIRCYLLSKFCTTKDFPEHPDLKCYPIAISATCFMIKKKMIKFIGFDMYIRYNVRQKTYIYHEKENTRKVGKLLLYIFMMTKTYYIDAYMYIYKQKKKSIKLTLY